MEFLFPVIILIDFTAVIVAGEATAVVNTTTGPVQGEILSTVWHSVQYASFTGIKYAQAPVGFRRFQPPVPVEPWTETFNATTIGDDCIQMNHTSKSVVGSEDCLFLNVFTPVTDLEETPMLLKSVMVWIYGGAFVTGSSSPNYYGPDYLLEKDVIIVSFNYRLGALGFLNLGQPNATGNAGLKDQNLALKWVQANIEQFGGNPKNITIFGESAGAVSVGFHIISDASAGLFNGAISMSGTPLVPWGFQSTQKALSQAQKLGSLIGTKSTNKETLLKAFYSATAEELVIATTKVGLIISFAPTIEDAKIAPDPFISECSINKYNSGNFNKVPQLLGFMYQETASFAFAVDEFTQVVNDAIDVLHKIGMQVPGVLQIVLDTMGDGLGGLETGVLQAAVRETTDILFISSIDSTQQLLANNNDGNPVYYYRNSFYTDKNLHNLDYKNSVEGAGHGDDIAEVFYMSFANYTRDPDDPITRTINRVTTMWSNFAKYGTPTPHWIDENPLNVTWPVSGKVGLALDIDNELTVVTRPTNANVKLIQLFSTPVLPILNDCPLNIIPHLPHINIIPN